MELAIWLALAFIIAYVVSGLFGPQTRSLSEGFSASATADGALLSTQALSRGFTALTTPLRTDVGFARDGWEEESGYERDLRYSESFADVQGFGVAADFCRAVQRKGDPDSLRMACALGRREGFDTMEYRSRSRGEGFRWSRDDYWRSSYDSARGVNSCDFPNGRMDYCRILKDEMTGEWFSSCAISGRDGFNVTEERDTTPPPHIRQLLEAYEDAAVWYRFFDDVNDYAQNTVLEFHGRPEIPSLLKADVSRGLQFNRRAEEPVRDYVRWGEPGTLTLDQVVQPRQIRAIAFWVWLDTLEGQPRVLDCANHATSGTRDRVWIGVEGGDRDLSPQGVPATLTAIETVPATEVSPQTALALGSPVEPLHPSKALPAHAHRAAPKDTATWVFEIWDDQQRIMRLAGEHKARAGQWQHVTLTTTDTNTWWPTWQMWVDGAVVANRVEGRTIPAVSLVENYLGRGMRGCIQDFRVYTKPMPADKIAAAARWMRPKLHPSP